MLTTVGIALFKALAFGSISVTYAIFGPFAVNAYVIVLLGFFALFLRFVPFKLFCHQHKLYTVKKKEISFYEKLRIKKWKDKVPELGKTGGFSKRNLQSTNLEYLKKF